VLAVSLGRVLCARGEMGSVRASREGGSDLCEREPRQGLGFCAREKRGGWAVCGRRKGAGFVRERRRREVGCANLENGLRKKIS
jgi:hypothetical protein